jgi:hypothetical protein
MSFNKTHRTPETECPNCGYKLDAVGNFEGDSAPKPGDASMCINCGELLEFDKDMLCIPMSDGLRDELEPAQLAQMLVIQDRIRGKEVKYH